MRRQPRPHHHHHRRHHRQRDVNANTSLPWPPQLPLLLPPKAKEPASAAIGSRIKDRWASALYF